MAENSSVGKLRSFHYVLTDKTQGDILATDAVCRDGALDIRNGLKLVRLYAPGTWALCEPEKSDDKA